MLPHPHPHLHLLLKLHPLPHLLKLTEVENPPGLDPTLNSTSEKSDSTLSVKSTLP